jgi:hypothetical protein
MSNERELSKGSGHANVVIRIKPKPRNTSTLITHHSLLFFNIRKLPPRGYAQVKFM